MMPFRFRNLANVIHQMQCLGEVRKQERLGQMMFVHDLPIRQLPGQRAQLLAMQCRNASAARNTMLVC